MVHQETSEQELVIIDFAAIKSLILAIICTN